MIPDPGGPPVSPLTCKRCARQAASLGAECMWPNEEHPIHAAAQRVVEDAVTWSDRGWPMPPTLSAAVAALLAAREEAESAE